MNKTILQLRESSGFYGAESVVVELAKELRRGGRDVQVGILTFRESPDTTFRQAVENQRLPVHHLPSGRLIDLKAIGQLRRLIKAQGIGIIQSHGYKSNLYALLAAAGTPAKLIATCHPWAETEYSRRARMYEALDLFWLPRFDRVVAISEEVREKILAKRVPAEKVTMIANGIDVERFGGEFDRQKLRRERGIPDDSLVVGTVGRLSLEKGHALLIEVIAELQETFPHLHLVLAGDGPLGDALAQQAARLSLSEKVHFLGFSDDIPGILALLDVFVLPSFGEGLPMALLEAMAARLPVVATRVGEIPKVVTAGKSGLLVPPQNKAALRESLTALLRDERQRKSLAQEGHRSVVERYSARKMAEEYAHLYHQLA